MDPDEWKFQGFTLEQLQEPEPVKYKKTGGRRKGKGGPGPVDKAVGNWLNWRSERRANRQRLIDEQEAQAKIRRQRNRNWLLRGSRDVTWQSPVIDSRTTKRVARRNLKSARERFANLSSEDKLNLHLQDISQNKKKISNTLDKTSETPGDTTNRKPEPLVNKETNLSGNNYLKNYLKIADKNYGAWNTKSNQSKVEVNEKRKEAIKKGEKDKTKVDTDAKPKLSLAGNIHKWSGVVSDLATTIDPNSKPTRYMEEFDPDDPMWWA